MYRPKWSHKLKHLIPEKDYLYLKRGSCRLLVRTVKAADVLNVAFQPAHHETTPQDLMHDLLIRMRFDTAEAHLRSVLKQ